MWLPLENGHLVLVRVNDFRAYRIAKTRGTQRGAIKVWEAMADLRPAVAVDVGANYGEFSCVALGRAGRVVAIEANGEVFCCLVRTLGSAPHAIPVQVAASDQDGTVTFYHNQMESGSGAMTEDIAGPKLTTRGHLVAETIPCRTLSGLVPELLGESPRSVILKVDVEGFEESVVRGAERLVSQCEWWLALLEFNPGAIRRSGRDPADVWAGFQRYFGTVLPDDSSTPAAFVPGQRLGREVPAGTCDLLIGDGFSEAVRLG